ncbi:MAG: hypothetical protein ACP5JU_00465 [Minisyncoccia bacterium]
MVIILNKYFPYFLSLITSFILLYFYLKHKKKYIPLTILIFLTIFFIHIFLLSYFQYKIWQNNPLSKFLLPPYTPISYFLSYSYHHFYKNFIWRIISGIFILSLILFLNKIFKNSLFYEEEYIIVPSVTLLVDFPFSFLIFFSGLSFLLFKHIISKEIYEKISIKDYWIFISIFFIILNMVIFEKGLFISLMP